MKYYCCKVLKFTATAKTAKKTTEHCQDFIFDMS